MQIDPAFVPDRFQSTIPYYLKYRLSCPKAVVADVYRRVGVAPQDRVLDLGCGPGVLTIDLKRLHAGEVIGFDPDAAMLEAAREQARLDDVDVSFVEASSYDLSPSLGTFKLVTMSRSFHWMDRVATLKALDRIIAPDGAVAIISETPEVAPENRWKQIVRDVQDLFTGRIGGGTRHHAAVVLDSAFSAVEISGVIERRSLTIDAIVGRAFSELKSSPQVLGDKRIPFEAELRSRLSTFSPSGDFSEIVLFSALIARRPNL